jgi:hypothetical protein
VQLFDRRGEERVGCADDDLRIGVTKEL